MTTARKPLTSKSMVLEEQFSSLNKISLRLGSNKRAPLHRNLSQPWVRYRTHSTLVSSSFTEIFCISNEPLFVFSETTAITRQLVSCINLIRSTTCWLNVNSGFDQNVTDCNEEPDTCMHAHKADSNVTVPKKTGREKVERLTIKHHTGSAAIQRHVGTLSSPHKTARATSS